MMIESEKPLMEVLDSIPFVVEAEEVVKRLRLRRKTSQMETMIADLLESLRPVARPRALYTVAYVEERGEDTVVVDGIPFTSRVLRKNLDGVERVFPYVATCGRELEEFRLADGDVMKAFCLDIIKTMALAAATGYLSGHVKQRYALGQTSHMNPGSLADWPLSQQKKLFSLFGNVEALIGVTLTESFVMYPLKSVSGIFFPTEVRFESCQLCPREKCPGRRAPYSPAMAKQYLAKHE